MFNEKSGGQFTATEEKPSAAFSDWTQKLKFDRSFTAKLLLSEQNVKEYYAALATELLSYEKVRARVGWSGVTFTAGRNRVASVTIVGKTLRIYLALDPSEAENGRYKAKDASDVKSRASTPSLLVVRSDGAKRHAEKLVAEACEKQGLKKSASPAAPVTAEAFRRDTFDNLVARGLIRIVRKQRREIADNVAGETAQDIADVKPQIRRKDDYDVTLEKVNALLSDSSPYTRALNALSEGDGKIRFSEKLILRSIDEIWVKAIEDALAAIDALIRNPRRYIAETEVVLPIELTKKISGRSIAHLGSHTNMIRLDERGEVTPMKMLNIFREDSILTYENKFLNTLIHRLYLFINRRYNVALKQGVDEKNRSLEYENDFTDGEGKCKIKLVIEYSERSDGADVKNTLFDTGLWKRVEKLNDVVTGYVNSSFCKSMERNFVRPPIMRTNAISKNKYFRECLALWEFIESYDDAGYGLTIDEKVSAVSDEYLKEIYEWSATQYAAFRRHAEHGYGDEENNEYVVRPDYSVAEDTSARKYAEKFVEERESGEIGGDETAFAVAVALRADELAPSDDFTTVEGKSYSFNAKIRLADDKTKENFATFANALLAFDKVKMRISRKYATFCAGRKTLARVVANEKSLKAYIALEPSSIDEKFFAEDVSEVKSLADTPAKITIKGERSLKRALVLLGRVASENSLSERKKPVAPITAADFTALSAEEMLERGWIKTRRYEKYVGGYGLPSFGPGRSVYTEVAAAAAKERAVAEDTTRRSSYDERVDDDVKENALKGAKDNSRARADGTADEIEKFIRPSGDYSRPTDYGVDDASAFIDDDKENRR